MEIYLLRHAIAEPGGASIADGDRALTAEGRKKLRTVLKVAARAGVRPDVILSSPLKRAVQTAEVAAEELAAGVEVEKAQCLVPDGAPEEVWNELRRFQDARQVLLAGHEPLIGWLAAFLVGGPSGMIDVKKASLIRIDVPAWGRKPQGSIRWVLTPALAEAMS